MRRSLCLKNNIASQTYFCYDKSRQNHFWGNSFENFFVNPKPYRLSAPYSGSHRYEVLKECLCETVVLNGVKWNKNYLQLRKFIISAEFTQAATEGKEFPEAKGRFVYFGARMCQSKSHSGLSVKNLYVSINLFVFMLRKKYMKYCFADLLLFRQKQRNVYEIFIIIVHFPWQKPCFFSKIRIVCG